MSPTWPVRLARGPIELRALRLRDGPAWRQVRSRNADWLRPWEATAPVPGQPAPGFAAMVRHLNGEARAGRMLPFALWVDGRLVGQVTAAGIAYGALRAASIGYWIDRAVAGRSIMPNAVALVCLHLFEAHELHRVEIAIRPENTASIRVVEKLQFRYEGLRPRYLHIAGDWRDHAVYALNIDEVPGNAPYWKPMHWTPPRG